MSKSKENKIERIKNQKIWPFVVMIVVTILVSVGMSVAILVLAWNIYMIVRAVRERRREKDILYTSTVTVEGISSILRIRQRSC